MDALLAWAQWMRATGASANTIRTRVEGVHSLCVHAGGKDPLTLTTMDIISWLADCRSQWTRTTYLTSARQWHRWLVEQGMREDDPTAKIPAIHKPEAAPRPAPTIAIEDVLEHSGRRARAYISLAAFEGLRCFEIAKIRGEDFVDGWLIVEGKGRRLAAVPIHQVVELLRRGWPSEGYWFVGCNGGHVGAETVSNSISKAFRRRGYHVTAHMLRHWYGTWVQRIGKDVRATQELMRHKSLGSTQIYTKVSSRAKVEIVQRLSVEHPKGVGMKKKCSVVLVAMVLLLAGCAGTNATKRASAPAPSPATTTTSQTYTPPAVEETTTEPPSTEPSVAKIGPNEWFEYEDGLKVQVTKLVRDKIGPYAAGGKPGGTAVVATVTIRNGTGKGFDATLVSVQATHGPNGDEAEQVFDEDVNDFSGTIPNGRARTATYKFAVPAAHYGQIAIEVAPSVEYDSSTFEGAAK